MIDLSQGKLVELLAIGGVIGFLSGMLGIGGGVLVIPALVLLFKFSQAQAVGTSLAMLLPPIGIFAVTAHYKNNNVNIPAAAMLACGFAAGGYFGGKLAQQLDGKSLRMMFAIFMLYVAGTMLFRTERRVWAVMQTIALAGGSLLIYALLRAMGRRWERSLNLSESYSERLGVPLAPDYEI